MQNIELPESKDMGKRDWGTETLLSVSSGNYTMKKLFIKAGKKGGLQKHHKKDETGYLVSGKLLIRHDNGTGKLVETIIEEGDTFRFPPGSVHQEEAIKDCIVIECSTPHTNDRIRCEKEYRLKQEGGLPTTELKDVISL